MPLAHILAPQIARKAAELDRQITRPSTGYLNSRAPVGGASPLGQNSRGRLLGKAYEPERPVDPAERKAMQERVTAIANEPRPTPRQAVADHAAYLKQGKDSGKPGLRTIPRKDQPPRAAETPPSIQDRSRVDNMPVFSKADSLGRQTHASNIAVLVERGQPVPPEMYQGLQPDEIAQAHVLGSEMRAYGGDPTLTPVPVPSDKPAEMSDGVYRGEQGWNPGLYAKGYLSQEAEEAQGRVLNKHGYVPGIFQDKTATDALQMMARQLQAQREAAGDPTAWMMGPSV